MELELTIWQRAMLITIIRPLQGDLGMFWMGGRVLDMLEFTEEERSELGVVEKAGQMRWPAEVAGRVFDFTLSEPMVRLVCGAVRQFRGWSQAMRKETEDLLSKLGIGREEDSAE